MLPRLFIFTGCAILASCSPFANRAVPLDVPSEALQEAFDNAEADPQFEATAWIPEDWWQLFGDPQLDCFIRQALENNPTLQVAEAKINLAEHAVEKVQAALYTTVNLLGDAQRIKVSQNSPYLPASATQNPTALAPVFPGVPLNLNLYETYFTFSYDLDIWCKNRNTVRAAIGDMQAKIADEVFARLALSVSVASVYYQLQIDYQRRKLAQASVENRQRFYELTQKRQEQNLDNTQVVLNTVLNVQTAQEGLLAIDGDIAVREYQLKALLANDFTDEINDISITQQPLEKVPLPDGLPLHLIGHRPDIISQLWVIESAGRQIRVAQAGFYPDLNLMGYLGYQSSKISNLFASGSQFGDGELAFNLPVFNGGLLTANLRLSQVNYDLAILQYNQLVLDAVKDVLTALAVLKNANQQLQEFEKQTDSQKKIFELTKLRVANNISSAIDELNSEQQYILVKDQELVALGGTIQAALVLIKAVGGGFEVCEE